MRMQDLMHESIPALMRIPRSNLQAPRGMLPYFRPKSQQFPLLKPKWQTSIPNFRQVGKTYPILDQNVQNLYPFLDQNGSNHTLWHRTYI